MTPWWGTGAGTWEAAVGKRRWHPWGEEAQLHFPHAGHRRFKNGQLAAAYRGDSKSSQSQAAPQSPLKIHRASHLQLLPKQDTGLPHHLLHWRVWSGDLRARATDKHYPDTHQSSLDLEKPCSSWLPLRTDQQKHYKEARMVSLCWGSHPRADKHCVTMDM